jgi:hypothetical protein
MVEVFGECGRLLEAGARPVVAAHLSGCKVRDAILLYRERFGRSPPRGMLPCSSEYFLYLRPRRAAATLFAVLHAHAERLSPSQSQGAVLLAAWRVFQVRRGDEVLDFNRAWMLTRFLASGDLVIRKCDACEAPFVARRNDPSLAAGCVRCD